MEKKQAEVAKYCVCFPVIRVKLNNLFFSAEIFIKAKDLAYLCPMWNSNIYIKILKR